MAARGLRILVPVGIVAIAVCTAVTRQPADFGLRQASLYLLIATVAVGLAAMAEKFALAWPLWAGLAIAATYSLAYDPVLPDAVVNRLPVGVAVLEPTVPLLIALVIAGAWALWPRPPIEEKSAEVGLALQGLGLTGRVVMATGVVLYPALANVYDLEGGYWLWRLTLSCAAYLGLMWIGIEGARRRWIGLREAAVMLAGIVVTILRSLLGGAAA